MERFKTNTIILLALCLTVFFGQQGVCSEENADLFDYGAYWMPLTEGNTKSFRSDTNNPSSKEPFEYTRTVTGPEVIKGFEAVKVEVTDSNHPLGNYSVGSYDALLPEVTIIHLGFEDATVPAGTFEDCLKTYTQIALSYAQNPQNNMSVATVTWDAEGVGTVKNELTELMFANEIDMFPYNTVLSGGVTELISATIDGVSYPQD